jgi:hypothetical protein
MFLYVSVKREVRQIFSYGGAPFEMQLHKWMQELLAFPLSITVGLLSSRLPVVV